jgi:hypothetical protein
LLFKALIPEFPGELKYGERSACGSGEATWEEPSEEPPRVLVNEVMDLFDGGQSWRQLETSISAFFTAEATPVICRHRAKFSSV